MRLSTFVAEASSLRAYFGERLKVAAAAFRKSSPLAFLARDRNIDHDEMMTGQISVSPF